MLTAPPRFSRLRHIGTAVGVLGLAGGAVLIVLSAIGPGEVPHIWLATAGIALIGAGAVAFVLIRLALKIESNTSRLYSEVRDLHSTVARYGPTLVMVADNTSISDSARSIAHRAQERDALRAAVYEEIRRDDFEAAFYLIDELERRLGFKIEAERLRRETTEARDDALHTRLDQALAHIDKLSNERKWAQAQQEIERLQNLMPADNRIANLLGELKAKRDRYKQELLDSWNRAVGESGIERGVEILKELDHYLTREEARSLESTARELFKERLLQLGVKFQFAVKEKRWNDALETGLEIMEEFPNARMAQEVREHLEALRERAGLTVSVEVTARNGRTTPPTEPNTG